MVGYLRGRWYVTLFMMLYLERKRDPLERRGLEIILGPRALLPQKRREGYLSFTHQSMCPWMPLWVLFISTDAKLSCVPSRPRIAFLITQA